MLEIEYVDIPFCMDTFPSGPDGVPFPAPLDIVWDGNVATVNIADIQLIFVRYPIDYQYQDTPYYPMPYDYKVVAGEIVPSRETDR